MLAGAPVTVLAQDEPRLVAALRSGFFRRAGIRLVTAATRPELERRSATERPHLVLLVAGQDTARAERELAERLRAILPSGRVLLLLAVPHSLAGAGVDLTLYDGLVSIEDPEAEMAHLVAPRAATPARRHARTPVSIPVEVGGQSPLQ